MSKILKYEVEIEIPDTASEVLVDIKMEQTMKTFRFMLSNNLIEKVSDIKIKVKKHE